MIKDAVNNSNINPVQPKERHLILDVLRGVALFGICLANFPEFSLYTFLNSEVTAEMPTSKVDNIIRYLQYIFIDGKFYTLFSLLFGVGFSIIIANMDNGFSVFYRRMGILFVIGFVHLIFIWSGDILVLYALLGLLLLLFRNISNKGLLVASATLLLLPIVIDATTTALGINLSASVIVAQQYFCDKYGITNDNFGYWLRDSETYTGVFQFLIQGAFVRVQEFIDGNRLFRVMGLFVLGYYIGRNRLYANLNSNRKLLRQAFRYGLLVGFPFSFLYAQSALNGHLWGLTTHSILYTISVFPLGLAYVSGICLWFLNHKESRVLNILSAPGRMALTNYIGQSILGIIIFYGIGFGLGSDTGLVYVLLIAIAVYVVEIICSNYWLSQCRFGPLEWIWRMLTYGKWLRLIK